MAGTIGPHQTPPMTSPIVLQKARLRSRMRAWLKTVSLADFQAASARACGRLVEKCLWQRAHAVLLYAPLPDELDLWPILGIALAEGKTVVLPRYRPDLKTYDGARVMDLTQDVAPGFYGIREPKAEAPSFSLKLLDLVLVPAVALGLDGCRLGRGKGFYDRLLAKVSGTKCGVAFDQQVQAQLPAEVHDIRLDCILTPTRWLDVRPRPVRT